MKTTVYKHDFTEAFRRIRPDNFSYAALRAMFDYFEQLEEEIGEEMELDVIAMCCDYAEYESAVNCIKENGYGFDLSEYDDDDEKEAAALEYLHDNTQVIEFDGGIITQAF